MWSYIKKTAFVDTMSADNYPQGKQDKRDTFDPDINNADTIFTYLHEQRDDVDAGNDKTSEPGAQLTDNNTLPDTDNGLLPEDSVLNKSANIFSRISDDFKVSYTPHSDKGVRTPEVAPIKASNFNNQSQGWLRHIDKYTNTRKISDFARKITFNSPIIGASMLAVPTYFGAKWAAPYIIKGVDNLFLGGQAYQYDANGKPILEEGDDAFAAGVTAAGVGTLALLPHFDRKRKGWGLFSYAPKKTDAEKAAETPVMNYQPPTQPTSPPPAAKNTNTDNMNKSANFIGPDEMIPIGDARQYIAANNNLSPVTRAEAMGILNAIPAPTPDTNISGGDILNAAVKTGMSALGDAAIGYVTASALGLKNPLTVAAGVGATSFVIRDLF